MIHGNEQSYITKRVHELYYGEDMNCARTTLTIPVGLAVCIAEETTSDVVGCA